MNTSFSIQSQFYNQKNYSGQPTFGKKQTKKEEYKDPMLSSMEMIYNAKPKTTGEYDKGYKQGSSDAFKSCLLALAVMTGGMSYVAVDHATKDKITDNLLMNKIIELQQENYILKNKNDVEKMIPRQVPPEPYSQPPQNIKPANKFNI